MEILQTFEGCSVQVGIADDRMREWGTGRAGEAPLGKKL